MIFKVVNIFNYNIDREEEGTMQAFEHVWFIYVLPPLPFIKELKILKTH